MAGCLRPANWHSNGFERLERVPSGSELSSMSSSDGIPPSCCSKKKFRNCPIFASVSFNCEEFWSNAARNVWKVSRTLSWPYVSP